jgi:predicted PurR-regulated permease PerM
MLKTFVVLLFTLLPLLAQQGRGTIQGLVSDSTGAAVPSAQIKVTNVATNQSFQTETTSEGLFMAPNLAVGEYVVTVEKAGFRRSVRSGVQLQVDQRAQQFSDQFAQKNLVPLALLLLKWLPSLLLVPYIAYFMLSESTQMKKYLIKSVPNAFFERALLLFSRLDASLQNYFLGLLMLTLLDTVSLALGLAVLGIRSALWLGLAAAVLAWIPYLGSAAGCVLVVLVAATDFPDHPSTAYYCLALFLCVRLLDDFVFLPLTIGRKLHIHPLLSVLMFFLGATVAGGTGLLLALPVLGVMSVAGEIVAQVVLDRRLRFRYRAERDLAAAWAASPHGGPLLPTKNLPPTGEA